MMEKVTIACEGADVADYRALTPYQGTLKHLTDADYQKLRAEILRDGFSAPFFVWRKGKKRYILDGHQRQTALNRMAEEGIEIPTKLPVVWVEAKDAAQAKRKVLALTSQYGRITGEGLHEFMADTDIGLAELEEFRFPEVDLAAFAKEFFPPDDEGIDEVPPPPDGADVYVKLGDVWELGAHTVVCGASPPHGLDADLLLTDPPYGVAYVGGTDDALTIQNDDLSPEDLAAAVSEWFDNAEAATRPGAYWYATVPASPLHLIFAGDWHRRGILRQIMVWVKDSLVLGHSEYHYRHEPILFGWRPGGVRKKSSDRTRTTVWEVPRPKASREHPTMKPVGLFSMAITDGSDIGGTVLDPFLGSGTTLIACEQLGRRCYGVEIEPKYVQVAIERWQTLTGKQAKRVKEGSGG